jgi:hypothetical protein
MKLRGTYSGCRSKATHNCCFAGNCGRIVQVSGGMGEEPMVWVSPVVAMTGDPFHR